MIDFEDNPTRLGDYIFERHEGTLSVISSDLYEELTWIEYEREKETWHPVDCFSDLIDALYSFKRSGFDIKLTGEEFKKLIEGSHASLYYGNCLADVDDDFDCGDIDCDDCKYHTIISDWVNFNRYDFIKDYGVFRRLALIQDDYTCLCCGNTNEKDLQVHHIKSFKNNLELATDLRNSAVLCKDCHKKYHKKYGYNATHKTFKKFIRENRE